MLPGFASCYDQYTGRRGKCHSTGNINVIAVGRACGKIFQEILGVNVTGGPKRKVVIRPQGSVVIRPQGSNDPVE